jgi:hypothetical protein
MRQTFLSQLENRIIVTWLSSLRIGTEHKLYCIGLQNIERR